jgi:hypothetical protein
MKMKMTKHWMKVTGIGLALTGIAFVANAQTTSTTLIPKQDAAKLGTATKTLDATAPASDISAPTPAATLASSNTQGGGAVRVVDSKGTTKYLQVVNGLTQVTNQDPTNGGIVTTWQLGGQFINDTKLDFNGSSLIFDNVQRVDATDLIAGAASLTTKAHFGSTTGWTVLVRDEATGAVKKLLASDLVRAGHASIQLDATTATANYTYTDATFPSDVYKVSVYRNGAKLLATTDYSVATASGVSTLTINRASGIDPEDYTFIAGDRIEIQWVK